MAVIPFQRKQTTGAAQKVVETPTPTPTFTIDKNLSEKRQILDQYKDAPLFSFLIKFLETLGDAMRKTFNTNIDYVDLGLGFYLGIPNGKLVKFILYGVAREDKASQPDYVAESFIAIQGETSDTEYKLSDTRNSVCLNKLINFIGEWEQDHATECHYTFFAPHILLAFAFSQGFSVAHYNLQSSHKTSKEFFIVLFNPTTKMEYRVNINYGAIEK